MNICLQPTNELCIITLLRAQLFLCLCFSALLVNFSSPCYPGYLNVAGYLQLGPLRIVQVLHNFTGGFSPKIALHTKAEKEGRKIDNEQNNPKLSIIVKYAKLQTTFFLPTPYLGFF